MNRNSKHGNGGCNEYKRLAGQYVAQTNIADQDSGKRALIPQGGPRQDRRVALAGCDSPGPGGAGGHGTNMQAEGTRSSRQLEKHGECMGSMGRAWAPWGGMGGAPGHRDKAGQWDPSPEPKGKAGDRTM